jgi:hypothetical protein
MSGYPPPSSTGGYPPPQQQQQQSYPPPSMSASNVSVLYFYYSIIMIPIFYTRYLLFHQDQIQCFYLVIQQLHKLIILNHLTLVIINHRIQVKRQYIYYK